jgi:hypothetical protein
MPCCSPIAWISKGHLRSKAHKYHELIFKQKILIIKQWFERERRYVGGIVVSVNATFIGTRKGMKVERRYPPVQTDGRCGDQ